MYKTVMREKAVSNLQTFTIVNKEKLTASPENVFLTGLNERREKFYKISAEQKIN